MRCWLRMLAIGVALACVACAAGRAPGDRAAVLKATGVAFLAEPGEALETPSADWDSVVRATGVGIAASELDDAEMRRLTATEAARCAALAQLAAELNGIQIAQRSRVYNMKFAGQELEAQSSGRVQGVRLARSIYNDSTRMAEVTLMVGLDKEGNIVPDRRLPAVAGSPAARKAQAEAAARIDALAKLREQLGEVRVGQEVVVKDLELSRQEAWSTVEGLLEGVAFAPAQWPTDEKCTVEASLELSAADLVRLQALAPAKP